MHSDIELGVFARDAKGTTRVNDPVLNGTKAEIEAIFGAMTKHDMGIYVRDNVHYWQYQAECRFKSDECYFSIFTELVEHDELDNQTTWYIDAHPDHIKMGIVNRVLALLE